MTIENGIARIHVHRSGAPVIGARTYLFKGSGGYLGRYSDTDDQGNAEFQLPDRQYKLRMDWEGSQYWTDPIDIIPHEVNEFDMDLDLLGFNLTESRLYAHNNHKKIQLAMVGLPYGLLVNSVIAAPSVTESIYYYHNDHLGTPQVLTDDNGEVVWKADYKPFGEVDIEVEDVGNNFRFPGQYYDEETGLHYNYFRDYHQGIGRYVEPDPVGLEGGINLYVYVRNNPINFIDPKGLKDFIIVIGPGGGVGYVIVGGGVFHVEITDKTSGEICMYTVRCFGIGVGLPDINVTSKPVQFNVANQHRKCSDFEGLGYIGGVSGVVGGGVSIGGGIKIPNGPFIPGELLGWNYGGVRIGVAHSACYFGYRGKRS